MSLNISMNVIVIANVTLNVSTSAIMVASASMCKRGYHIDRNSWIGIFALPMVLESP